MTLSVTDCHQHLKSVTIITLSQTSLSPFQMAGDRDKTEILLTLGKRFWTYPSESLHQTTPYIKK